MANVLAYSGKLLVDQNGHVFKYGADSGSITITENGTHDVNGIATAIVNVKGTITYVFEVVNHYTGAVLSDATIQIKHNGTLLTTITTNSSGIASYITKYCIIEYVVSYSGLLDADRTITPTEVGTVNISIPMFGFPAPSSHTPGDIITWDDKEWLVCHYNSTKNRVYLIAKDIISTTSFGSSTSYPVSTLASVAATYQTNNMSAAALDMIVDTTISSVTGKVFVPYYGQLNGEFSWFNSDTKRIAKYQGNNYFYWTSSADYSSGGAWAVDVTGSFTTYTLASLCGFRPCVCVQL